MNNILFLLPKFWIWWTEKTAYIFMKSLKNQYNVYSASIFSWWERYHDFKNDSLDILIAYENFEKLKNFVIKYKINIVYMHWISWHKNSTEFISFLIRLRDSNIKIIETSPFSLYTPNTEKYLDYKLFVSKWSLLKFLWKFKKPKITNYDFLYNPLDINELKKHIIDNIKKQKIRLSLWIKDWDFVVWKIWRNDLWKWDDTIIDVVPSLIKKIPNLKIVIRAIPTYKINKLKRMWIFKYFIFLPESADEQEIANTYQIMDVMLHTSRIWESFWIALAEWMFYWLPVLSIDTDWMQWTAYDRDNSQWEILWQHNSKFISNDRKYLAHKIIKLYDNKDYRKDIWKKNKEYALNNFDVESLNSKLINIFENKNENAFDYNKELNLYKKRVIKESFFYRLLLSCKAIYESIFNK